MYGHGGNEDSDTEGTALEKEPDGWEVFKDWGSVVHILDSQANLVNKKLLNCPILIFVSCLFEYKSHWLELCKMLSLEFQINSFVGWLSIQFVFFDL